ncbi:hypothetical protein GCM10027456_51740 [Kineosporia babensis]
MLNTKGKPCGCRVAGHRTFCRHHPEGRSKYKPPQRPIAQGRSNRPWAAGATPPTKAKQRNRRDRLRKRAGKAEARCKRDWSDGVLHQAIQRTKTSGTLELAAADCQEIADAVALLLMEGYTRKPDSQGWGFLWELFGGPSAIEEIATATSSSLAAQSSEADLAAARALQMLGIALCQRAGIPLSECPCFVLSATWELERVLFLLLRMALGDWTGLAIPFTPLSAP